MIFSFPELKRHEKQFCSRIFQIITAYVKGTNKLKFIWQSLKAFHILAITSYFHDQTFYTPNPFGNLT